MTRAPKENAPQSWQAGRASSGSNHHTRQTWSRKWFPGRGVTYIMLAALLWPAGVSRFQELGIRPADIDDDAARLIAAKLVAGHPLNDPEVRAALEHEHDGWMSWGDAILFADAVLDHDPTGGQWARESVERFARENAKHWLPADLEWVADQLRTGDMTFEHAVGYLDRQFSLARPCLLRDSGGGAP